MALLRVYAVLLGFLSALYLPVFLYFRSGKKERLEDEFAEKLRTSRGWHPNAREAFVRERLAVYERRLHRRLIPWIYGAPVVLVTVVIMATSGT